MAEMLVCRHGEIAEGGVRIVRSGRVEIGVIRHGGRYYAYRNHCPHQGEELRMGSEEHQSKSSAAVTDAVEDFCALRTPSRSTTTATTL